MSEMGRRVGSFDWSRTPLGSLATWSPSLKAAAAICLRSPSQMALYLGPELNCIYNDAERDALGRLHPAALGQPARELLRDSWDVVGPQLEAVMRRGESTWAENQPRTLRRRGKPEVTYLTYSYSPILEEDGSVGGVLRIAQDVTGRVLAERRIDAIRELLALSLDAPTTRGACARSCRSMSLRDDFPFALVYLLESRTATCMAARAAGRVLEARRPMVQLDEPADEVSRLFYGLATARSEGRLVPASLFIPRDSRHRDLPERAFAVPIARGRHDRVDGFLVAGIRDDLEFDAAYATFAEMAAVAIGRGVAAATWGRFEERARHEGELRALLNDLRAAQRRVAVAGDAERRRIERDLHDGAQQRLMALRLELGLLEERVAADPKRATEMLRELRHELDEAVEELRELAHGLYPPLLASDGLVAALAAAARRSAIPVTIDESGMTRAPRSIESTAYFCCLEALQNAAKHAGPEARATIELRMEDEVLSFTVRDDGAGFDPGLMRPGYGLINLRDRLNALGGDASVTSSPGAGTTVSGHIPLP
jgi:signal transduction histidine kinase